MLSWVGELNMFNILMSLDKYNDYYNTINMVIFNLQTNLVQDNAGVDRSGFSPREVQAILKAMMGLYD